MSTHKYYIIFGKEPTVDAMLYKCYCIKAETKFEAELTLQEILNCPKKVYDENHNEHIYNGNYFIYYSSYNDAAITKDDFALVDMGFHEFYNPTVDMGFHEFYNPTNDNKLVIMNV